MSDTLRPNLTGILRRLMSFDREVMDTVGREAADRIEQLEAEVEELREQISADHTLITALGRELRVLGQAHPPIGIDAGALIYMARHHRDRSSAGV